MYVFSAKKSGREAPPPPTPQLAPLNAFDDSCKLNMKVTIIEKKPRYI